MFFGKAAGRWESFGQIKMDNRAEKREAKSVGPAAGIDQVLKQISVRWHVDLTHRRLSPQPEQYRKGYENPY